MPKGGPTFEAVADPIGVWLDEGLLFVWDAYAPIGEARFFDAACNRWLEAPLPPSVPRGFAFDRRYGVSSAGGKLLVYGPTWETKPPTETVPGPFRVLVFDAKTRTWLDASPPRDLAGRESKPYAAEGKLVLLAQGKSAFLDTTTSTWQLAAEPNPFTGEPGCQRIGGAAWDVWTDGAHQRLDLATRRWTRTPIPQARFQRCTVHPLGPGEDLVASPPISAPGVPAGMVFDRASLGHTEIAGTGLEGAWLMAAGAEIWTRGGSDALFLRYDRAGKRWVPVALPASSLPGKSALSLRLEPAGAEAVLRNIDPPPYATPGQPATAASRVEAWVWRKGSFGATIELGVYDSACDRIQAELGLLCKRDGDVLELLEPQKGAAVRTLPAAPAPGYLRRFSSAYAVSWGLLETRSGNNCDNPFRTEVRQPNQPTCTPSHGVTFTRAAEGGSVYRFAR